MDSAFYPDELEEKTIEEWPYEKGWVGLMEFIFDLWKYPEYWNQDGDRYKISTGGWSGNEQLIGAMQANYLFWSMCWVSSRRGGHYEFEVKKRAKEFS